MAEPESDGLIRANYEAIAESISDVAYVLDADWNIAYTNQSSVLHPDVSLEAIRDDHVMDFIERIVADGEDPERFVQALETVYNESADADFPVTVELKLDSRLGTATREYRCLPCETESGTGAIVVSKESTERRESKLERYERLFEALPVAVGINTLGEQGQFEFVNQAAVDTCDANSKSELKQYSPADLYADPNERERFSERLKESGTVEQYETEFTTLAGERIWVSITAELFKMDGENHIVGTIEDISDRKEKERELREAKAFTDRILDTLPDVFYAFDAQANLIEYNERLCSVTGYDHDEVSAMAPWEFFPEEEREKIADAVSQVLETGESVHSVEGHYLTKSGAEIPYEFSGAPFYDDDRTVAGFVGFGRDISDRKKRERGLQKKRERLQALFEDAPEPIFVQDNKGQLFDANKRAVEKLGYSREELLQMEVADIDVDVDRDDAAELLSVVKNEGETLEIESRHQCADGSRYPVEVRVTPLEAGGKTRLLSHSRDITERKEREQRYKRLTERIRSGYYALDNDWEFTYWNDVLAERHGTPAREVIGETIWEQYPEIAETDMSEALRGAMESGEQTSCEFYYEKMDYWTELQVYPDENGISVLSTEITDRKEREQELTRNRKFLKQTQNVANIGGWEIDLRADTLTWTDEVYNIFGKSMQFEPTVQKAIELFHAEDQEKIQNAVERVTTNGEPYDVEVRIVRPGGEVRWTRTRGEPKYEDGEIVGALGTFQDITSRKEREQELKRHQNVIQAVDDGVYALDEEGHFELVNDAMSELTGYDTEALLGEHTSHIKSDAVVERAESVVRSMVFNEREENEATLELEIQRDDDSEFPAEDHMTLLWDDDGERFEGTAGIIRNITERKAREQELQTTNKQLEVLNRILRHDIQNDVQVIEAWARKLQSELPETYQDEVQRIVRTNESIKELTQNGRELIQSFTQEETETEPVRLDNVIEGELNSARSRYSDAEFTVDGPLPVTVVSANGTLSSVVRNLLNNAVQHNRDQAVVTIRVEQDGDAVRLLVIDNGPGVPDDQNEEIFGKGERGLESDGTGIGLYLVNQLVQSYGGDVWVENSGQRNSPNPTGTIGSGGAVFVVELPTATG